MKLLFLITVLAVTFAAPVFVNAEDEFPGRVVSASLGVNLNSSHGDAVLRPPDLLRIAPVLQLSWGMQVAQQILVTTQVDILGGMLPLLPSGAGVNIGVAWLPGLDHEGWRPLIRFATGLFHFASGGEGLGPDYDAYGFRLAFEVGLTRGFRRSNGFFRWGIVAGAQAAGLLHVAPCGPDEDCTDVLLGPSLRAEAILLF